MFAKARTVIVTANTIVQVILFYSCFSICSVFFPSKAWAVEFSLIQSMRVEAPYKNPRYITEKRHNISRHSPVAALVFSRKAIIVKSKNYAKLQAKTERPNT